MNTQVKPGVILYTSYTKFYTIKVILAVTFIAIHYRLFCMHVNMLLK